MAPRLDIFHSFSQSRPHATYESFLVGGRLDANSLFVICSVCMYFRMKAKPPGLAYTYCWLGCCGLSLLATADGKSLAACMGIGLNFGWYMSQLIHSNLWPSLLPYWEDYLPKRCVFFVIRVGDLVMHVWPCALFFPYTKYVGFRVATYSFLLERWYFFLIEKQLIGTGHNCNLIYDLRPRQRPTVFITCQYMSTLAFFTTAIYNLRTKMQIMKCSGLLLLAGLCLFLIWTRTDRFEIWKAVKSSRGNMEQCQAAKSSLKLLKATSIDEATKQECNKIECLSTEKTYETFWDLCYAQWTTGCRSSAELSSAFDEIVLSMQTSAERLIDTAMNSRIHLLQLLPQTAESTAGNASVKVVNGSNKANRSIEARTSSEVGSCMGEVKTACNRRSVMSLHGDCRRALWISRSQSTQFKLIGSLLSSSVNKTHHSKIRPFRTVVSCFSKGDCTATVTNCEDVQFNNNSLPDKQQYQISAREIKQPNTSYNYTASNHFNEGCSSASCIENHKPTTEFASQNLLHHSKRNDRVSVSLTPNTTDTCCSRRGNLIISTVVSTPVSNSSHPSIATPIATATATHPPIGNRSSAVVNPSAQQSEHWRRECDAGGIMKPTKWLLNLATSCKDVNHSPEDKQIAMQHLSSNGVGSSLGLLGKPLSQNTTMTSLAPSAGEIAAQAAHAAHVAHAASAFAKLVALNKRE